MISTGIMNIPTFILTITILSMSPEVNSNLFVRLSTPNYNTRPYDLTTVFSGSGYFVNGYPSFYPGNPCPAGAFPVVYPGFSACVYANSGGVVPPDYNGAGAGGYYGPNNGYYYPGYGFYYPGYGNYYPGFYGYYPGQYGGYYPGQANGYGYGNSPYQYYPSLDGTGGAYGQNGGYYPGQYPGYYPGQSGYYPGQNGLYNPYQYPSQYPSQNGGGFSGQNGGYYHGQYPNYNPGQNPSYYPGQYGGGFYGQYTNPGHAYNPYFYGNPTPNGFSGQGVANQSASEGNDRAISFLPPQIGQALCLPPKQQYGLECRCPDGTIEPNCLLPSNPSNPPPNNSPALPPNPSTPQNLLPPQEALTDVYAALIAESELAKLEHVEQVGGVQCVSGQGGASGIYIKWHDCNAQGRYLFIPVPFVGPNAGGVAPANGYFLLAQLDIGQLSNAPPPGLPKTPLCGQNQVFLTPTSGANMGLMMLSLELSPNVMLNVGTRSLAKPPSCAEGQTLLDGKCYWLAAQSPVNNAQEADNVCRQEAANNSAGLASVHSEQANQHLAAELQKFADSQGKEYARGFLGMFDGKWTDGSAVDYVGPFVDVVVRPNGGGGEKQQEEKETPISRRRKKRQMPAPPTPQQGAQCVAIVNSASNVTATPGQIGWFRVNCQGTPAVPICQSAPDAGGSVLFAYGPNSNNCGGRANVVNG